MTFESIESDWLIERVSFEALQVGEIAVSGFSCSCSCSGSSSRSSRNVSIRENDDMKCTVEGAEISWEKSETNR